MIERLLQNCHFFMIFCQKWQVSWCHFSFSEKQRLKQMNYWSLMFSASFETNKNLRCAILVECKIFLACNPQCFSLILCTERATIGVNVTSQPCKYFCLFLFLFYSTCHNAIRDWLEISYRLLQFLYVVSDKSNVCTTIHGLA